MCVSIALHKCSHKKDGWRSQYKCANARSGVASPDLLLWIMELVIICSAHTTVPGRVAPPTLWDLSKTAFREIFEPRSVSAIR